MKRRPTVMVAALLLAAMVSCSREGPFVPGRYALSGHVKLRAYFVDRDGAFAGTRIIGDADGVPVELLYGKAVLATTTTRGGVYRFAGLSPGGYAVRSRPVPGIDRQTHDVVVGNQDLPVADTLELASVGDLYPVPNPFADSLLVLFQVADSMRVKLALVDVGGQPVRTFFDHLLAPATYQLDFTLQGLPAGSSPTLYWMTFRGDADLRAQLLVRESAVAAVARARPAGSRASRALENDPWRRKTGWPTASVPIRVPVP